MVVVVGRCRCGSVCSDFQLKPDVTARQRPAKRGHLPLFVSVRVVKRRAVTLRGMRRGQLRRSGRFGGVDQRCPAPRACAHIAERACRRTITSLRFYSQTTFGTPESRDSRTAGACVNALALDDRGGPGLDAGLGR